ncbi:hypothetical protein CR513_20835, partial [Mucuna pruriens]
MSQVIIQIKQITKHLSCLGILDPKAFLSVETDVSKTGYGGILKNKKNLVRIDYKAIPSILQNNQVLLSCFDFDITYIKGDKNSLPGINMNNSGKAMLKNQYGPPLSGRILPLSIRSSIRSSTPLPSPNSTLVTLRSHTLAQ